MRFEFIAKHRGAWRTSELCEALGVSRGGFYDWLERPESHRSRDNRHLTVQVRTSFEQSDQTYGDDIMDAGKYIEIPHKNDLGLGKPLALNFARRALPDDFEEVAGIFQHRGAYGRFKSLLERRGKLAEWYEFENENQREALRAWCEANGIDVEG